MSRVNWPTSAGIVVHQQITNYFGVLLFLTFQTRRWPAARWLLRLCFLLMIVLIGPSWVMEGEHWPTDVAEGFLVGAFWLLGALHVYWWAAISWTRLLAPDERAAHALTGSIAPRPGGGSATTSVATAAFRRRVR